MTLTSVGVLLLLEIVGVDHSTFSLFSITELYEIFEKRPPIKDVSEKFTLSTKFLRNMLL